MTPIDGVPYHRSIRDLKESFGFIWCAEGFEICAGTAENKGLKAH